MRGHASLLVLAVAGLRRGREDRDDDLGLEPANDAHGVFEDRFLRPLLQCLVERPGVPEVERAGEELTGAVDAARRQQLLRANETELLAELRTDQVLAALTAREREVGGLAAHAARHQREQRGVLVVGMGADDQHAAMRVEPRQQPMERDHAAGRWRLERFGSR